VFICCQLGSQERRVTRELRSPINNLFKLDRDNPFVLFLLPKTTKGESQQRVWQSVWALDSASAMRFRTLEIRWHDSKPISTCDFQPISYKKARPGAGNEKAYTTQAYRLASGGEDNHVRVSAQDIARCMSGLNRFLVLDMDGPSAYKASKCCGRGCCCSQTTASGVSRNSQSSFSRR
jgi:hypothetical protein